VSEDKASESNNPMKNLLTIGCNQVFQIISKQSAVFLTALAAILYFAPNAGAVETVMEKTNPPEIFKIEFGPEYYYWQENGGGKKLLDESGLRYALELSGKAMTSDNWLATVRFKAYYGHVDYNGQTQLGTPVKSTTDYYGGLIDFGFGYRWTSEKGRSLDVIGRLGVENWERDLNGAGGYGEHWLPVYVKLGLETAPKKTGWNGALGIKAPVWTYQHVDLSKFGAGSITLHPQTMPSGYAEAGYRFNRHLSLAAYFDSYWFAKSPTASNGIIIGYQPESITYQAGIKVGWNF
jgi:hypothetical protein